MAKKMRSTDTMARASRTVDIQKLMRKTTPMQRERIYTRAKYLATTASADGKSYGDIIRSDSEYINRHEIEKQRKFTLSIACLLLFLVGAPFGSIVRKG